MACIGKGIAGKPGDEPRPPPAIDETGMSLALLRAPPFPGIDASVTRPGTGNGVDLPAEVIDRTLGAIREARVGGAFWLPPAGDVAATAILRARSTGEAGQALSMLTEMHEAMEAMGEEEAPAIAILLEGDAKRRAILKGTPA